MRKTELVFVPLPMMGHLPSMVELAKLILRQNDHVSIQILIIDVPNNSTMVKSYVEYQSNQVDPTCQLTFVALPPLSAPPDFTSPHAFYTLLDLNKPLVKQAIEGRAGPGFGSLKPACLVVDMLCVTMMDVVDELRIPSYVFFPSNASFLNLFFHLKALADEKGVDSLLTKLSDPNAEFQVPGFRNRVPSKVWPGAFLNEVGMFERSLNQARRLGESKGILVNSFSQLESSVIRSLLDQGTCGMIPDVYPVGPILDLDSKSRGGIPQVEDEESIMRWLDEQPTSSVVFLCFGSMGSFGKEQVKEIANGLDRSGHRFLWSLRPPLSEGKSLFLSEDKTFLEALPEGFLDRVAKRGKVIGWAPQLAILSHRATGGFVSHCGWNSTMESLWFGVPMATWPMYAEQQLNAFQLVKELGLAVEIRMDYRRDWKTMKGNFVVTSEEIENGVRKLMSMDAQMRGKVREMGEKGRGAIQDGGSSYYSLSSFIEYVIDHNVA